MRFSRRVYAPLAVLGATLLLTSCAVNELNLPEGSDHFGAYYEALKWAQDFARTNRALMMEATLESVRPYVTV